MGEKIAVNILLTSVGRRSYMVKYFQEILGKSGKVFTSNNNFTYAMQVSDGWVLTPLISDKYYVDFLLQFCRANNVGALISLLDISLPVLAKNKHRFEEAGVQVVVSSPEAIEICNDKWKTYTFLKNKSIPVPNTFLSLEEALKALRQDSISFPVIVKPRWGMGSIQIMEAHSEKELTALYTKISKDIFSTNLKYESIADPKKCVIIQEKLIGQEYGLDVFNDLQGNYLACVPKKKLAMRAGETDSAETVGDENALELGKKISRIMRHIGNLDVDCFLVGDQYYVLEMNCRFGGQYPFSHLAGVNFPAALISLLQGKKASQSNLVFQPGIIGFKDMVPVVLQQ